LIGQIIERFKNCHILQAEGDKDIAISLLAVEKQCPIISSDSDFLLFGTSCVIRLLIIYYNL